MANITQTAKRQVLTVRTSMKWSDALRKSEGVMADDVYIDDMLRAGKWKDYRNLFPCTTGTALVYEAPDTPFGSFVRYENVEFNVPKDLQGRSNIALALRHPDINIEEQTSGIFLIKGPIVKVIENFPTIDEWYNVDADTGVPQGVKVSYSNRSARYLCRRQGKNGRYVGPVVRSVFGYDAERYFYVDWGLDVGYAVGWLNPAHSGSSAVSAESKLALEVKGVTLEEFRTLVRAANNTLDLLSVTNVQEELNPIRQLVRIFDHYK